MSPNEKMRIDPQVYRSTEVKAGVRSHILIIPRDGARVGNPARLPQPQQQRPASAEQQQRPRATVRVKVAGRNNGGRGGR